MTAIHDLIPDIIAIINDYEYFGNVADILGRPDFKARCAVDNRVSTSVNNKLSKFVQIDKPNEFDNLSINARKLVLYCNIDKCVPKRIEEIKAHKDIALDLIAGIKSLSLFKCNYIGDLSALSLDTFKITQITDRENIEADVKHFQCTDNNLMNLNIKAKKVELVRSYITNYATINADIFEVDQSLLIRSSVIAREVKFNYCQYFEGEIVALDSDIYNSTIRRTINSYITKINRSNVGNIMGKDVHLFHSVTGNIKCTTLIADNNVQVEGDIECDNLIIGPMFNVLGSINCENIIFKTNENDISVEKCVVELSEFDCEHDDNKNPIFVMGLPLFHLRINSPNITLLLNGPAYVKSDYPTIITYYNSKCLFGTNITAKYA